LAPSVGCILGIEIPTVKLKRNFVELKIVNTCTSPTPRTSLKAPSPDDYVRHFVQQSLTPGITQHSLSDPVDIAHIPTSANRDPTLTSVSVTAPAASHLDNQPIESLSMLTAQHSASQNRNLGSFGGGKSDNIRDPRPVKSFNPIGDLPALDADLVLSESRPIPPSHFSPPPSSELWVSLPPFTYIIHPGA
jgi:hypothetical protein